jgi:hypothetical protein
VSNSGIGVNSVGAAKIISAAVVEIRNPSFGGLRCMGIEWADVAPMLLVQDAVVFFVCVVDCCFFGSVFFFVSGAAFFMLCVVFWTIYAATYLYGPARCHGPS